MGNLMNSENWTTSAWPVHCTIECTHDHLRRFVAGCEHEFGELNIKSSPILFISRGCISQRTSSAKWEFPYRIKPEYETRIKQIIDELGVELKLTN